MDYKIFWCKLNKYYLNKWLNYFWDKEKKSLIISTCVVTDRAKKKCIKEIVKLVNDYEKIYITWCISIDKWTLIPRDNFFQLYTELEQYSNKIELLSEFPSWEIVYNDKVDEIYTKKFIVIQNGCDNYCTFCMSILKRWSSCTRPMQEIIDEINQYSKNWAKEIVLTWLNIAAYWATDTRNPTESKIFLLLENILKYTDIPRIRLSSLGPEYLDDRFFRVIKDSRIMPHFHLSIQSFSDNVLKLMNRNYDNKLLDDVLIKFRKLERHDNIEVSIWADLIVWFPWETDQDFDLTYESVKKYNINKLHVFPFSSHNYKDTIPAWKFPNQVKQELKKQREKKLIHCGDEVRNQFLKRNLWKNFDVLIEEKKDWKRYWWTPNYIQIWVEWVFFKWEIVNVVY